MRECDLIGVSFSENPTILDIKIQLHIIHEWAYLYYLDCTVKFYYPDSTVAYIYEVVIPLSRSYFKCIYEILIN